jgi:hypothetical protein
MAISLLPDWGEELKIKLNSDEHFAHVAGGRGGEIRFKGQP